MTVIRCTGQPPSALQSADFQRAMNTRPVARSAHFAVHFLPPVDNLSTAGAQAGGAAVDDLSVPAMRLGLILPKKLARRSVTRSLIKHQARDLWRQHLALPHGDWVLRLKAPWPRDQFPSAASEPLKLAVRAELSHMLARLCRAGEAA